MEVRPPSPTLSILPYPGFPMGVLRRRGTYMASSGNQTELIVSLSRRVHQYWLPPWAPQSGEHRTIQECSRATLVKTFPRSLNLEFP